MYRLWGTMLLLAAVGCADPAHLRRSEQVVFFPTVGYQTQAGDAWVMPIHGWVYQETWLTRNLPMMQRRIDIESLIEDPADRARLYERLAPFLVSHQDGRRLRVILGDRTVPLSPAMEDGHFRDELRLPSHALETLTTYRTASGVMVRYHALHRERDPREYVGLVHLTPPEGLTIVSDIDDTIRMTDVLNTKEMIKNTFIRSFRSVPGMAELYRDWVERTGAHVHYLSASPTQLATPLKEFFAANGFPDGTLALRTVDWQSNMLEGVLEMFEAPPEFKIAELAWLMSVLPGRTYVLIGDSAQSDPEVYGTIARSFREQVPLILIRDVTCCEGRDSPRYREAFRDLPDSMWVLFRETNEIRPLVERVTIRGKTTPRTRQPIPGQWFVRQLVAYN